MATLTEQINEAWKAAMRSGDTLRKDTLSVLRAAIKNAEIAGRTGGEAKPLDDAAVLQVIEREAKKRRDAADEYDKLNRPERAEAERAELAILQEFLPAPLTEEELDALVRAAIAQVGASGPGDMGKVMPVAMAQAAGRADGKRLSAAVRKLLAS